MPTARDIIYGSLRLLGVRASGETPSASEADDGLDAMNAMLGSWSLERLFIYALTTESFTLVVGTSTYTMGPSGTFNTVRPEKIISGYIRDGGVDYSISIDSRDIYNEVSVKAQRGRPEIVFAEYAAPQVTVKLAPTPDKAYSLTLDSQKQLTAFALLDTSMIFPAGYERALRYSLAVELAPEYGVVVQPEIIQTALRAQAAIKRNNLEIPFSQMDDALVGQDYFDIETGYA